MTPIWQAWCKFWFAPKSLLNLAIFRVFLCGSMFLVYSFRLWDVELLFSADGFLPRHLALKVISVFMRHPFKWFIWSDSWSFAFHVFFLIGLLLLTFGVGGRILSVLVWVLHISFLHRNILVSNGADRIATIYLLYLAMTQSCVRLSVLNLFRKNSEPCGLLTSVFYRMIQIQVCVIYVFSGIEKLKGKSWWDGTAIWNVVANQQVVVANLTWLRMFPLLIVAITYGTILFEVYFPILIWNPRFRLLVLFVGFIFHSGVCLVMGLWSFLLILLSPYVLFLTEREVLKVFSFFANIVRSFFSKRASAL